MAGLAVFRRLRGAVGREGRKVYAWIESALLGPEDNVRVSTDPIMEVVNQNPLEALLFIKVVMLFGAITGFVVSAPCAVYLSLHWTACNCDRPLQWWVTVFTALQVPQLPVRYLFFCHLRSCPRDRRSIVNTVRRMTLGVGWRVSKCLSIFSYGWFILGAVWLANSNACHQVPGLWRLTVTALVVSIIRLAATFVCFYVSFPAAPAAAGDAAAAAGGSLWRRGATAEEIQALPIVTYETKLLEMQQQQQDEKQDGNGAPTASGFNGCVICLNEFAAADTVRVFRCNHFFHSGCIDTWLAKSRSCPLCLRSITHTPEKQKDA